MARLDGGRELTRRRARWAAALRSLYFSLRTGRCDCFYVLVPDAFAVLFCAPGVRGAPPDAPAALLSPSSRGLRARLAAAGVRCDMPLAPDADAGAEDALEELAEFERANPGSTRVFAPAHGGARVDGTPASCLVAAGTLRVHALFNFLHNFKQADSAKDVPMLLAGVPFEGACLQPLRLAAAAATRLEPAASLGGGKGGEAGERGGGGGGGGAATSSRRERVYTATVRSAASGVPLGPWNLARLCEVLRGSQDGEFTARFDAHPLTAAFNLALPLAAAADAGAAGADDGAGAAAGGAGAAVPPRGAYGSAAERAAAREALGWPDDAMAAVACANGIFTLPPQRR
jgi:hypothetical protein